MGSLYKLIFFVCLLIPVKLFAHEVETKIGFCTLPDGGSFGGNGSYHELYTLRNCLLFRDPGTLYFDGGYRIFRVSSVISLDHPYGTWEAQNPLCPPGHELDRFRGTCKDIQIKPEKNTGTTDCKKVAFNPTGNPINQGTGNKLQLETDYLSNSLSPLSFKRYYNSTPIPTLNTIGNNWLHSYSRSVIVLDTTNINIFHDDGKAYPFQKISNLWFTDLDINDKLTELASNGTRTGWQLVTETNQTETYDAGGKLLSIKDVSGVTQTLTYSTASTPVAIAPSAGLLLSVADSFGRSLNFTYDASGRIATLTDPAGNVIHYGYDGVGNLTTATYSDGSVKTYVYGELAYTANVSQPNALTGIIDANGVRYGVYQYDASGKAVSTEHATGGMDKYAVEYAADGSSANITDPLGTVRTTHFTTILGVVKSTGSDQPAGSGCNAASNHITYDSFGNILSRTDFNGNVTTYVYDFSRNLEISRTEASDTPQARTISTQWHDTMRLPIKRAEPKKLTTTAYDAQGNVLTRTEQTTNDITGAAGLNPTVTGTPRTWTYTYNSLGQLLTEDGPRTDVSDVTTYAYYADTSTTAGSTHHIGDLASVTDALGHVTNYTAYDGNGQLLRYSDANGLVTTLTYDARGRLLTRTVDGNTTQYGYDAVGNLTRLTLPGQGPVAYRYDAGYRLIGITDAVGNTVSYTLDALGNTTQTVIKNADGSLAKSQSTQFDALGRIQQQVGAQQQTSQYGYDANGNLTTTVDPNNHPASRYSYDALDRLKQLQDAAGNTSQYAYDGLDQLSQVTAPNGAFTQYSVDALGNRTAEAGPDRGSVQAAYDAAGNLTSLTDARGITVNYTYDALNRLLTVRYPAPGENITYTYDSANSCSNGITRLCQVVDATGSTVFSYDLRGNLIQETRTEAGHSYTTRYAYDAANRLSQLTNPDNRPVSYSRDSAGRITGVSAPANSTVIQVISQIATNALGLITQQTFGNGFVQTQSYDSDGQPITTTALDSVATGGSGGTGGTGGTGSNATVPLPAWAVLVLALVLGRRLATKGKHKRWPWLSLMFLVLLPALILYSDNTHAADSLSYDANGNISQRVQGGTTFNYTYDPLDRLLSEAGINTQSFTYDANGNRLTDGTGSYTYPNNSNQLLTAPGRTLSYDLAGNLTSDGRFTYTYNQAGQLAQVSQNGTVIANYAYDYRGRRTQKTVNNATTVFVYDPNGHPLAEASSGGTIQKTYLWRDDTPALVIDSTGTQDQLYYLQADTLNSPRAARNQAGTVVWSWPQDAFGTRQANEDPDGNGQTTKINLRFPGQYYDAETQLHYNWNRYYDPNTGRYISVDPIGLAGGLNTYAYVGGNPLTRADPTGKFFFFALAPSAASALADVLVIGGLSQAASYGLKRIIAETDEDDNVIPFPLTKPEVVENNECPPDDPDKPNECELLKGKLDILYVKILQEKSSPPPRGGDPFTQRRKVKSLIEQYKIDARDYNAMCVKKGFPYRNPNIFD